MMKRSLIVLLVLCVFASAMIARDRRALKAQEQLSKSQTSGTVKKTTEYCAKNTPCSWSVYRAVTKYVEINITNTYCICPSDKKCVFTEDDTATNVYVFHCR